MKFATIPVRPPCAATPVVVASQEHITQAPRPRLNTTTTRTPTWARRLHQASSKATNMVLPPSSGRLGKNWMEYQGINNWEGLLDPLDDTLRAEIIRYGQFVEATYCAFNFDPTLPTYATCKYPRNSLLARCGLEESGYRMTKNLRATCGIRLPRWLERAPRWATTTSSWIGYVAVCEDKEEISRLGRRDVVIAYRGTATCMEWLENFRANLTTIPHDMPSESSAEEAALPMVEGGFLSLYNSQSGSSSPSLRDMVREEVSWLLRTYGDEPLSFTITGHSLGAALATLTAYDIDSILPEGTMLTVVSFGGPRVGNRRFRRQLEKRGTRILRIVNSDDVITKLPGFLVDNNEEADQEGLPGLLEKIRWDYAHVGQELRLSSRESPYFNKANMATCHELSTYIHLVKGFVSSACPFRDAATRMLRRHHAQKMQKLGFK